MFLLNAFPVSFRSLGIVLLCGTIIKEDAPHFLYVSYLEPQKRIIGVWVLQHESL